MFSFIVKFVEARRAAENAAWRAREIAKAEAFALSRSPEEKRESARLLRKLTASYRRALAESKARR